MKKSVLIAGLLVCAIAVGVAWATAGDIGPKDKSSMYDLVGKDFFAGLAGDRPAIERALKTCENVLSEEPKNAAAMAWQGAGLMCLSGFEFEKGEWQAGSGYCRRGLARLDEAAKLTPSDPEVLVVRGMTLAQFGLNSPRSKSADEWIAKGVQDLSSAIDELGREFAAWPADSRGQVLLTLADGLQRLGRAGDARTCYQRIVNELPGTTFAVAAGKQLNP